ncbi:ABC transporter permease [Actinomadura chibensis]|uniref:ABC transporter permease n=1 Tax=Actinomadura chibensis TaxID=392828 RepID=A0A5D0ND74_9ACTN|nr:ABC transporter permease [Actinomadura chibensis]TYB42484.1 ABC transporter permease [Actinomadura chibensis]
MTGTTLAPARSARAGGGAARRPGRGRAVLAPALLGAALFGGWQLAAAAGATPGSLPSPADLAAYLGESVLKPGFWSAAGSTMLSWTAGFAVSVLVGCALGMLAGLNGAVDRLLFPVVEFFRPIPSIVYLPLVILVAGTGRLSVVVLVAGGAVWPVLLQTVAGVHDTDPVLRDMTRAYAFTRRERMRWCVLPSAAPFIATGVRISATISLVVVVTTELVGTGKGLGGVMSTAYQTGSYVVLFGTGLAAAVLGVLIDQALGLLEKRALHWHAAHREGAR